MKIAYFTRGAAESETAWSGIPYWTIRNLREAGHVVVARQGASPLGHRLGILAKVVWGLLGQKYLHRYSRLFQQLTRRRISHQSVETFDAVFCQELLLAACVSHPRLLVWCDAEARSLHQVYSPGYWSRVRNKREVDRVQEKALSRARHVLCASEWGLNALAERYPQHRDKLVLAPFFDGLSAAPSKDLVDNMIADRSAQVWRFLFIGVDWNRKGGDRALALVEALRTRGHPAELTIIGCSPFVGDAPPFVKQLGFLNKSVAEDRAQFEHSLADSHFLLLPSRAEAMGIALIEAHAFGVPTISSDVGGIPTVVRPGLNGVAVNFEEPQAVVEAVCLLIADRMAYGQLARNARKIYEEQFSKTVRLEQITRLLESHAGGAEGRAPP